MTARRPLITAGGYLKELAGTDTLQLNAGATAGASVNVPHGAAPTSPADGDIWTTTAGVFAQVNGSTVGPLGAGGSGSPGGSSGQIQYNNAGAFGGFTASGDATINTGSGAVTIANDAVTYAKMQNISATSRILGRKTSGSGDPEEITASEALDFIGATQGTILYRSASGWSVLSPGASGQVLQANGAAADPSWASPAGGGVIAGSVQVDIYATPGTATWTKPSGAKFVIVEVLGAGGGGGSGSRNTAGTNRGGGSGGLGGARSELRLAAAALPSSVTVTVGAPGSGGAARTADGSGNNGTDGGASSFGAFVAASGGLAGQGSATGGGGRTAAASGGLYLPQNSTAGTTNGTPADAASSVAACGSGGGGSGVNGSNTQGGDGGDGAPPPSYVTGAVAATSGAINGGGAGGAAGGSDGSAIADRTAGDTRPGAGGGGGSGNASGAGGSGGKGQFPGGGGGGGGGCLTGFNSGAGADGGGGQVVVTTYF